MENGVRVGYHASGPTGWETPRNGDRRISGSKGMRCWNRTS